MKSCLKCNFATEETDRIDCPKCGAIYSKVEELHHQKAQHSRSVRSLSDKLEFELESDAYDNSFSDLTEVQWFERDQYPVVGNLAFVFYFLAAFVAIGEVFGLINFYQTMHSLGLYRTEQLITYLALLSFGSLVSIAVIVAFPSLLIMSRDMANDARATKEFLRIIASRLRK